MRWLGFCQLHLSCFHLGACSLHTGKTPQRCRGTLSCHCWLLSLTAHFLPPHSPRNKCRKAGQAGTGRRFLVSIISRIWKYFCLRCFPCQIIFLPGKLMHNCSSGFISFVSRYDLPTSLGPFASSEHQPLGQTDADRRRLGSQTFLTGQTKPKAPSGNVNC